MTPNDVCIIRIPFILYSGFTTWTAKVVCASPLLHGSLNEHPCLRAFQTKQRPSASGGYFPGV